MLKTDSAQSIANKVATGLENIVNVYRGSEGDREIIPLDKPEQITFGDTALSDDDIRTIAIAKTFDDILGIPVFSDAFSTLEKHPAEKFGKTSKNCISDFLSALKLWEKDKTLFSGVSFKDSDFVRTTWPSDAYEAFLTFRALKELIPSIHSIMLNKFLIQPADTVLDD